MKTVKTRGLVIRSLDYKDTSKIVYILTPLGYLSVRALGSKKFKNKNYNIGEVLTYITLEITDSSFPTLVEASVEDNFRSIKDDFNKFLTYSYMLEFLNKIPDDIPYEKTLDFILNIIRLGLVYDPLTLVMMLQLKFLPLFGIKPNFKKCVICESDNPKFISIKSGALCDKHKELDSYEIKDILKLYYFDIKKDDFSLLDGINKDIMLSFIKDYYEYHAELRFKSINSLIIK